MRLVRSLLGWIGTLLFVGCAGTVTAQFIGIVILSSQGMLTHDKIVRYAGVLYGVDPLDMSAGSSTPDSKSLSEKTPEELLADRVKKTPHIKDRQTIIYKGADDIRSVVMGLKFKRDNQASTRKAFEGYLDRLEEQSTASALREIQATLESLPAKQAKDILFFMLDEAAIGPHDDAMADVVTLVKAMPSDKLRKIFGEFKSNSERELLHRILVEIGNLDERNSQLTGTQP